MTCAGHPSLQVSLDLLGHAPAQTDRQTDRQIRAPTQTDAHTDTDRCTHRQMHTETDGHTDTDMYTHRQTDTQAQTCTETDRCTHIYILMYSDMFTHTVDRHEVHRDRHAHTLEGRHT